MFFSFFNKNLWLCLLLASQIFVTLVYASESITKDYVQETLKELNSIYKETPKEAEARILQLWERVQVECPKDEGLHYMYLITKQYRKYRDLDTARELAYKTRDLAAILEERDIFIDISLIAADLERKTLSSERALKSLGEIFQFLEGNPSDNDFSNAYNLRANIYKKQKQYSKSAESFLMSLDYSRKCGDKSKELRALRNLASIYRNLNKYEESLKICDQAVGLARELEEFTIEANFYLIAAETERKKGRYKASIHYAFKAMEIYQKLGDHKQMAKVHGTLGQSYMRNCRYDLALEHSMTAYEIVSNIYPHPIEIAKYCNNIGNIYERLMDVERAKEYYNRAYTLSLAMNQTRYQAESLSNQGSIYTNLFQYEEALGFLKRAHQIHKEIKNDRGVANTSYKLGQLLYDMGNHAEALAYLNKGKTITEEVKDQWLLAKLFAVEAQILFEENNKSEALKLCEKAMNYASITNSLSLKSQLHELMATIYESLGDYKKAFIHTKQQALLNDEIINTDIIAKVSDIQHLEEIRSKQDEIDDLEKKKRIVELENERRTNELRMLEKETLINQIKSERARNLRLFIYAIVTLILIFLIFRYFSALRMRRLLSENNILIKEKNDQLNASNQAKDKFFSIISHDLKGPLGAVISLSELLESEYESMSEQNVREFIRDINSSANKTFKLLEELLDWARLQLKAYRPKLKIHQLDKIVDDSVTLIKDRAQSKNIYIEVEDLSSCEIEVDADMISSVIRNLLTNAIKFSPEGESISVYQKNAGKDKIEIHVKDFGVGISEDELENLFKIEQTMSHQGTAGETGTGLGLIICKEMVEQHGGEIRVKSKPGIGSDFYFTVNLRKS